MTVFILPFVIYFASLFKALITPAGDQLNLYLKSFGIAGKPPQYDSYITSFFWSRFFLDQ